MVHLMAGEDGFQPIHRLGDWHTNMWLSSCGAANRGRRLLRGATGKMMMLLYEPPCRSIAFGPTLYSYANTESQTYSGESFHRLTAGMNPTRV